MVRNVVSIIRTIYMFVLLLLCVGIFSVKVEAADKILQIDQNLINQVGNQTQNSSACGCFSMAYCRTILDGRVRYYTEFNNGGTSGYAIWYKANYTERTSTDKQEVFRNIIENINAGSPVIVYCGHTGRYGTVENNVDHYVAIVGYQNVTDINNLTSANFLMYDSGFTYNRTSAILESFNTSGMDLGLTEGHYRYFTTTDSQIKSPPEPVTNLRSERNVYNSKEYIKFDWNPAKGTQNYWIYLWKDGKQLYQLDCGTNTTFTSAPTSPGNYTLCIRPGNSYGFNEDSKNYKFTVTNNVPDPITTIGGDKCVYSSGEKINFKWENSYGTQNYWIYLWKDGKQLYQLDCGTNTSYSQTALSQGKYTLIIRPGNVNGFNENSNNYKFVVNDDLSKQSIHLLEIDEAVKATCIKKGKTEGKHCSLCGSVIVEQMETDFSEHSWNDGVTTKEATSESEGEITYTCTVCGETKIEKISKSSSDNNGNQEQNQQAQGETQKKDNQENEKKGTVQPDIDQFTDGNITLTSMTVSEVTPSTNYVIFRWLGDANASGYEVQYSYQADMTGILEAYVSKNTSGLYKLDGLSPNTIYYYRVRAYKGDDPEREYSEWTSVMSFKTSSENSIGEIISKKEEAATTPNITLKSVKNTKKKTIVAKWKWNVKADGYQISYAKKRNFSGAKKKNVNAYKDSVTIKKLTKGKTYYVKIRSYVNDNNGNKVYGKWSSVKKVKIKK